MSIQAMSKVIGSHGHGYLDGSPSSGALFLVELMIADSVNDQNGNVFWMSNVNLARKARVSRETANRCVAALEHWECCEADPLHVVEQTPEDVPNVVRKDIVHADGSPARGVLKRLGHHDSGAVKWRWTDGRKPVTTDHTCDETPQEGVTTDHKTCADTSHEPKETQDEPKPADVDFAANTAQVAKIKRETMNR